jgi:pyrroline-5-carboxylate reductase
LPRDVAAQLALAMTEGAAILAATSSETPTDLARRVTSPGGTTAAGLAVLDSDSALNILMTDTLRAARDRGAELAKGDAT